MKSFNEYLGLQDQIDMEERIAQVIMSKQEEVFEQDHEDELNEPGWFTDEDCNDLGRYILNIVLEKFRPELFAGEKDHDRTEL